MILKKWKNKEILFNPENVTTVSYNIDDDDDGSFISHGNARTLDSSNEINNNNNNNNEPINEVSQQGLGETPTAEEELLTVSGDESIPVVRISILKDSQKSMPPVKAKQTTSINMNNNSAFKFITSKWKQKKEESDPLLSSIYSSSI